MNRRQELLRDAGNFKNIHDYEKARAAGAQLTPLPNLLIVLDEFCEMLTAKPEFIDLFIQIGRIGRSLGVHLLLASQRLEEGKLRGLDTYLSYRLGLKTFSAAESRVVLGVPDAYNLPSIPGSGFLKTRHRSDAGPGQRSRPPTSPGPTAADPHHGGAQARPPQADRCSPPRTWRRSGSTRRSRRRPRRREEDDALADTVLDVLVRQLEGEGPPAHQVWLPPLARAAHAGRAAAGHPGHRRPRPVATGYSGARPAGGPDRHRRQAVRAEARGLPARPVRRRRPRGRSSAVRGPASPPWCARC